MYKWNTIDINFTYETTHREVFQTLMNKRKRCVMMLKLTCEIESIYQLKCTGQQCH